VYYSGNILEGKQEKFAKDLHQLAQELPFNSMKFESLINDIRTQVAEVSWHDICSLLFTL
jgi:hypothetical protein